MNSQGYKLRTELEEGLQKYGESNNLSPISIIEKLVEDFLCDEEVLCVSVVESPSKIEKIKNANYRKECGAYRIRKSVDGKRIVYGQTKSPIFAKEIINFLESKEWDIKYSTKKTGLKGVAQINFLFNEMEKEGFEL